MMLLGCLLPVFRSIASLVLGLVIFFGLLLFLLVSTVRDNFLTSEFYTDNLSENNVYDRVYDEVLLDPEFEDTTDKLLGRIEFAREDIDVDITQKDMVEVAREIIPLPYLRSQVEGAIESTIDYLNKDTDTPEVFIELGPPLKRAKPALFRYMDRRIDELDEIPVTTFEELQAALESLFRDLERGVIPTRVPVIVDTGDLVNRYVDESIANLKVVPAPTTREFRRELQNIYIEFANGKIPTSIPSIEAIPVSERIAAYDQVIKALRADPTIPEEAVTGLEEQEELIKSLLRKGDIKAILETASRPLTGPVVELFVDDTYDRSFQDLREDPTIPKKALDGLDQQSDAIKRHLGVGEIKEALKLGLRGLSGPFIDEALDDLREELDEDERLDLVAEAAEQNDQTVDEFLDDLDTGRDIIERGKLGSWLGVLLIVGGALLMGAVHFPHISSGLRWPGLTLLLSGLVFLLLGLVLKATLFQDPLDLADVSQFPPTLVDIINDVSGSMGSDVAGGIISVCITVMVIGAVLLVGSYVIRLLHIPFLSR